KPPLFNTVFDRRSQRSSKLTNDRAVTRASVDNLNFAALTIERANRVLTTPFPIFLDSLRCRRRNRIATEKSQQRLDGIRQRCRRCYLHAVLASIIQQ